MTRHDRREQYTSNDTELPYTRAKLSGASAVDRL